MAKRIRTLEGSSVTSFSLKKGRLIYFCFAGFVEKKQTKESLLVRSVLGRKKGTPEGEDAGVNSRKRRKEKSKGPTYSRT